MLGEIRVPSREFSNVQNDIFSESKCHRLKFVASTSSFMQKSFLL